MAKLLVSKLAIKRSRPLNIEPQLSDHIAAAARFDLQAVASLPSDALQFYRKRSDIEWMPFHADLALPDSPAE
eukprot:13877195-Alexandrium_andersonii.AAC.1